MRNLFRNQVHELLAPETLLVEAAHALTRAEHKGIIVAGEARLLYSDLLTTLPQLYPVVSYLPRAIELSSQMRIGVFDCLYLALAEQAKCEVVTADARLVTAATGHKVTLLGTMP